MPPILAGGVNILVYVKKPHALLRKILRIKLINWKGEWKYNLRKTNLNITDEETEKYLGTNMQIKQSFMFHTQNPKEFRITLSNLLVDQIPYLLLVRVISNNLLLSNWSVRIGIEKILTAFNPVILFLENHLKYKSKYYKHFKIKIIL